MTIMLFDTDFKDKFANIRCFDDSEVADILSDLKASTRLEFVFSQLFPSKTVDTSDLYACQSVDAIQSWILGRIVPALSHSYKSITVRGLDQLSTSQSHVFISNHRDIAMDPMLINLALYNAGHRTAHSAIGDNLLLSATGTRMALLNKCFRVARSITSPKALLNNLKAQASYIRSIHAEQNENVWIAQSEGRAIDNIDTTNPALIKMLTLGVPKAEQQPTLNTLRIVPVTLSYEWDPCDLNKAQRLTKHTDQSPDKKLASDKADTLLGILGFKGAITVHFGKPVSIDSDTDATHTATSDTTSIVAEHIDKVIRQNYEIYPINRIAKALVLNEYSADSALQDAEPSTFDAFKALAKRTSWQDTSKPPNEIQQQVIENYARPLLNRE